MFTSILNAITLFLNSALSWLLGVVCGVLDIDTAFLASDKYNEAVNFFFYTIIEVLILLSVVIFLVTMLRSYLPPAKIKRMLSGSGARGLLGYAFAALLGAVSPFCTCSAISIFFGLLTAGVPLGMAFSLLAAAPLFDEIAFGMLWMDFGWGIALLYVLIVLVIGIVSGLIIGKLKMDDYVEDYMTGVTLDHGSDKPRMKVRIMDSLENVLFMLKRVWVYVLIGVAIGAVMVVSLQEGAWIAQFTGRDNPFAVIVAVALGLPFHNSVAAVVPIVKELTRLGVPIGTALSFMLAVAGLSITEIIILKKFLKTKLLLIFVGIVLTMMIVIGYVFNIFFA